MSSFINSVKAIRSPAPRELSPFRTKWLDFAFWFETRIWYRFVPSWLDVGIYRVKHWWYEQVSSRVFPRQRWLTRAVPRTWTDKTELIPDLLLLIAHHYVAADGEDALNVVEHTPEQTAMLREIDEWYRTGRAAFLKQIEEAYPPLGLTPKVGDTYDKWTEWLNREDSARDAAYNRVEELEAEFEAKETSYLVWIVTNRGMLWC